MKHIFSAIVIYLCANCILFSQTNTIEKDRVEIMHQKINQVADALSMFKINKSVDELEKAVKLMGNLPSPTKAGAGISTTMRQEQAKMWLNILSIIDNNIKIELSGKTIYMNIIPPMASNGIRYPSGTDPKDIKDPTARERYEFTLNENNEKATQLLFQTRLRNTNRLAISLARRYFNTNYTSSKEDQKVLDNLFSEERLSPNQIIALRN